MTVSDFAGRAFEITERWIPSNGIANEIFVSIPLACDQVFRAVNESEMRLFRRLQRRREEYIKTILFQRWFYDSIFGRLVLKEAGIAIRIPDFVQFQKR
jgi:hypothetical protein